MMYKKYLIFGLTIAGLALPAFSRAQNNVGVLPGITVGQGWTRLSTEAGKSTPAFFTIHNGGLTPDTLVSTTCPVAHRTILLDRSGKTLGAIEIKPGETITLTPQGQHLMLEQNRFRFYARALIPCSVDFLGAGEMILYLHVEPDDAKTYHPAHRPVVKD